jgi:predicted transcriptional regulator
MLDVEVALDRSGQDPAAPPARSRRRATARRASSRRAAARSRQDDTNARITDLLGEQPGSTAGDLAKALNLNPEIVANYLSQLAKTGDITKKARGYSAQPTLRRRSERP